MFLWFFNTSPVYPCRGLCCQLRAHAGGLQPLLTPAATTERIFQRAAVQVCNIEHYARLNLLLLSCCCKQTRPLGNGKLAKVHQVSCTLSEECCSLFTVDLEFWLQRHIFSYFIQLENKLYCKQALLVIVRKVKIQSSCINQRKCAWTPRTHLTCWHDSFI